MFVDAEASINIMCKIIRNQNIYIYPYNEIEGFIKTLYLKILMA
jgi:hypothetical protein